MKNYPWYSDLPNDWDVLPFRRVAIVRNGQLDPTDVRYRDLPLYAPNHVESGSGRLLGIETAAEQGADSGKYPVRAGEIVYSKIRPELRKVMVAPRDGLCSADMYAIAPTHRVSAPFLFWCMLSDGFNEAARLVSERVAMPKVNRDTLAEFPIPVGPVHRQRAIADFLDRKTAAIDDLIAKKERLIELLEEKRAALINQAVTKGLDPNVPMKDSGIPWIGEIPSHWDLVRSGRIARLQRGFDLPSGARAEDGAVPIIAGGGITGWHDTAAVKAPGIVTGRYGTVGKLNWVETDFWPLNTSYYVRDYFGNDRRFVYFVLGLLPFAPYSGKSAVPGIDRNDLAPEPLPRPPVEEQRAIADYLDRAVAAFDLPLTKIERQLRLLAEYRQSLITAAVTGQLDIAAAEGEAA